MGGRSGSRIQAFVLYRAIAGTKSEGKTVLAITHDDQYFYVADRCIKLEEGRVTADDYPSEHGQQQSTIPEPLQAVAEEMFSS